jgi:hypothetical protein
MIYWAISMGQGCHAAGFFDTTEFLTALCTSNVIGFLYFVTALIEKGKAIPVTGHEGP